MKPLTSGDIELNLNGQTLLSVDTSMLLNMRLRQLGLRPLEKLVFNTLAITLKTVKMY